MIANHSWTSIGIAKHDNLSILDVKTVTGELTYVFSSDTAHFLQSTASDFGDDRLCMFVSISSDYLATDKLAAVCDYKNTITCHCSIIAHGAAVILS